MRRFFGAVLLVAAAGFCATAKSELKVDMTAKQGLRITSEYCELSAMSRVIAIEPPWGHCYFNSNANKVVIDGDGKVVTMKQAPGVDKDGFDLLEYQAEVLPDGNSALVTLRATMLNDAPAVLEYSAIAIPGYTLADCDYQGVSMDGTPFSGHIDAVNAGEKYTYGANFKRIDVATKLGVVTVEVLEGPGMTMIDRRGAQFMNQSCYWVGFFATKLSPESEFVSKLRVSIAVDTQTKIASPITTTTQAKAEAVADEVVVRKQELSELPLFPAPKKMEQLRGRYIPDGKAGYTTGNLKKFSEDDLGRLERAAARLLPGAAVDVKYIATLPPEGYMLRINSMGISIAASTARGAFYAMQTARLLEKDGSYPCVRIEDWPDLKVRGVHLCLDAGERTYYDLVEKVFAPAKMNTVIGEVEYVKWDATKEMGIHVPDAMSKEDLAEFVALCHENFIDFVPLMQTLGHCGWLFVGNKNLEYAEDPDHPYTYNVAHPNLYPLITAILDELFEICHPEYLHIGHDEVNMRGKFPNRPENIAKGAKQLIFDDVMFFYNYAKEHGAQIMMWHDMFMAPHESSVSAGGAPHYLSELRPDFPHDIIFCVWIYNGSSFPEFKLLEAEGFRTIGCSWFGKRNPEQLAMAVKSADGLGLIVTTWAGYFGSRTLLTDNYYQVEPYVRGGCWAWTVSDPANEPYDFAEILSTLLHQEPQNNLDHSGVMLDLGKVANLSLAPADNPFLLCDNLGLDTLPSPDYYGNVKFLLPEANGERAAIAFNSRLTPRFPDGTVTLDVDGLSASALHVLSGTNGLTPPDRAVLGRVTVEYEDGSKVSKEVAFGVEVGAPDGDFSGFLTPANSRKWKHNGKALRIWKFDIPLDPKKQIAKIILSGSDSGFAYYILGVSASK